MTTDHAWACEANEGGDCNCEQEAPSKDTREGIIDDFEERLSNETDFRGYLIRPEMVPVIRSYVLEKLALARQEERERCKEIVKKSRTVNEVEAWGKGLAEENARNQVLVDILALDQQ